MSLQKKHAIAISIIAIILGILFFINIPKSNDTLQANVFTIGNGYGYRIIHKEKIVIQQENIPTLSGINPFINQEDAKKTALLVIQKLKKGNSPRVSTQDLQKMEIKMPFSK